MCVVASYTPSAGDLAHYPGMCSDWESNQLPFGSQDGAQSTESHQSGLQDAFLKLMWYALTSVVQLVGTLSHNQKVAGLIPGQGTCLGCRFNSWSGVHDSWSGHIQEATSWCFSLALMFLSLSLPLSLKSKKIVFGRRFLKMMWKSLILFIMSFLLPVMNGSLYSPRENFCTIIASIQEGVKIYFVWKM